MEIITNFVNILGSILVKIPWMLLGLLVGWVIIKILVFFLQWGMKLARIPKDYRGLLVTFARFILWIILVIIAAQAFGLGSLAVAITGSAAIAAFFLSASLGPLLSNIFAGLFLLSDPDIKVGMKVRVNDGKVEGVIHGSDMRKMRIIDKEGLLHVVPNSLVEGTEWVILDRNKDKK